MTSQMASDNQDGAANYDAFIATPDQVYAAPMSAATNTSQ
jgi:hypothetical protein